MLSFCSYNFQFISLYIIFYMIILFPLISLSVNYLLLSPNFLHNNSSKLLWFIKCLMHVKLQMTMLAF